MKYFLGLLGIWVLAVGTNALQAAPMSTSRINTEINPYAVTVGGKCTRLIRRNGRESIYNACSSCRKVSVIRKRRGISTPVRREFNLLPGAKLPIPFRGPGSSRITSDILCKGAPNPNQHPINSGSTEKCVALEQRPQGKVVLVNSCGTCRGVAINRTTKSGRSMGIQAYKLRPLGVVGVVPKGADHVVIAGEVACPT
jgi:hypothetical protein